MAVVSNDERLGELIHSLCQVLGIADAGGILRVRSLDVGGFDVHLDYLESDVSAMYLNMFYGTATAGRTWKIFRLMLEASLLILRLPFTDILDGSRLAVAARTLCGAWPLLAAKYPRFQRRNV